jgi:uncharacterized protein
MVHTLRRFGIIIIGLILVSGELLLFSGSQRPMTAAPVYAQAQATPEPNTNTLRTITVSGSGSADVIPDQAIVSVGVQTDAQTASQALAQNNTQMKAVMDTLTKAGVANADIQTTYIQLNPRYENPPQQAGQPTPTDRLVGYTATNTVQVKVRKLDSLGTLLDQVVAAGGNQIQGISFNVSDPAAAIDKARQAAMNDASHKAQQLASLTNATLGLIFSITENSQAPIPFPAAADRSAASSVPVSPGTQTVTVNLQAAWIIQP